MSKQEQSAAADDRTWVGSTNGVELALHRLVPRRVPPHRPAQSSRPRCLIAHATGFHGRCYRFLAEELSLSEPSGEIWAPDLRGHGDSSAPSAGDYSWDGFAEDVLAVLDHMDFPPIRGIGHSMGGAALLRAEQLRPGTFQHLFVYEPIVFPPLRLGSDRDSPLVGAAERRRSHFDSFEQAIDRFGSKPPLDALDPRCLEDYVRYGFRSVAPGRARGIELKMPGADEADVYRMSTAHETWDRLGELDLPIVVACGRVAPDSPAAVASRLVERLPHAQLLEFADLGHFGPLESPAEIAEQVLAAWREHG